MIQIPEQLHAWMSAVAEPVAMAVIAIGLLQNVMYLTQLMLAGLSAARRAPVQRINSLWNLYSDVSPPIALLVPAHNEQETVVENVNSLLSLQYPTFEVLVINDGSKDETLQRLIETFGLEPVERAHDLVTPHQPIRGLYASPHLPRLLVIDKENGGKADALNAGINLARAPLFCAVDADSLLEAGALLRAVQPFIDNPLSTVVVGGTVRIVNGCRVRAGRVVDIGPPRNLLALFQTVEYLRAFLMGRLAWSEIGSLVNVSGAFGIFRRRTAMEVGGYSRATVGEDIEIIVRIHRYMSEHKRAYTIKFIPDPVCWTEAPESLRVLARQRIRWQRGALETLFTHRRMLFNPRYGRVGFAGLGDVLLADFLGPIAELLGYILIPLFWLLGALDGAYMLAFIAVTFSLGIFISVSTLILEEIQFHQFPKVRDLLVLAGAAVMENFGYRQANNFWKVVGLLRFLRGQKGGWGQMTRTGFRQS
ncbi:glycosyltransferase family 2 protein [Fodinicurvata halophila]|uniref:Glycosyltransferase family 2 protein n=1 Tax=Fodinicurvata halophila TaxID=1419723 RepID=A0ABV8UHN9_9PROT